MNIIFKSFNFNEQKFLMIKGIALLKADDYVKHKAEKYKEVISKGGEIHTSLINI